MKIVWEVDDGYVGGSRPLTTEVHRIQQLKENYSFNEFMEAVETIIYDDFKKRCYPNIKNSSLKELELFYNKKD